MPAVTVRRAVVTIEVVDLAAAFGWRALRQWRRTGDAGLRISRRSPTVDRFAGLTMTTGLGIVAGATLRWRRRPPRAAQATGLALMVLSVVGTLKAQVDLGRSWRLGVDHDERTELVTTGLFARVRNPIFTGMAATAIGAATATGSPTALAGAVLVVTGIQIQVRAVEEPYLTRTHGDDYVAYARRTGRFLPTVGRFTVAG